MVGPRNHKVMYLEQKLRIFFSELPDKTEKKRNVSQRP